MGDPADGRDVASEVVVELEWLDQSGEPLVEVAGPPRQSVPKPGPFALLVMAVIVVVGLTVAIRWIAEGGSNGSPDSSPDSGQSATPTLAVEEVAESAPPDLAAAIENLTVEDLNGAFFLTLAAQDGVDIFASIGRITTMPGDYRLAYIGVDGNPIVIDTGTGEFTSITEERPATTIEGLELLYDGRGMIGLDPDDLSVSWRVTNDARLVRGADGSLTIIAVDGVNREVGEFTLGEVGERTPIPASAHVFVLDGIGVFVLPQSGGGFLVEDGQLRQVTPHRLRSAGVGHVLIRTRGEEERLDLIVDLETGEEIVLDPELIDLGGDLLLSPDGEWVVVSNRDDGGPPALYAPRTGTVLVFEPRSAYRYGVWAPDSSFVAALAPSLKTIWVEFLDGTSGAIPIDSLGIPALSGSPVVVF